MVANQKRLIFTLMFSMCFMTLAALFFYLWTFDYNPQEQLHGPSVTRPYEPRSIPRAGPKPGLAPSLTPARVLAFTELIEEDCVRGRIAKPFLVRFTLRNAGAVAVRLLDAPAPGVLYDLLLTGPDQKRIPMKAHDADRRRAGPDEQSCETVVLLPGRKLELQFDLQALFELTRPGPHLLKIVYQPEVYAKKYGILPIGQKTVNGTIHANAVKFNVIVPAPGDASAESKDPESQ